MRLTAYGADSSGAPFTVALNTFPEPPFPSLLPKMKDRKKSTRCWWEGDGYGGGDRDEGRGSRVEVHVFQVLPVHSAPLMYIMDIDVVIFLFCEKAFGDLAEPA